MFLMYVHYLIDRKKITQLSISLSKVANETEQKKNRKKLYQIMQLILLIQLNNYSLIIILL